MRGFFLTRAVSEAIGRGPEGATSLLGGLLPGQPIHCMAQVHGVTILQAEKLEPGAIPECDGLVSGERERVLCVRTADCVPVLAWDDVSGVHGAFHAGWRGLAGGIIEDGIERMRALGATNIKIAIGPAIGPCCFEVGPEVVAAIGTEFASTHGVKPHLDLWRAARARTLTAGIAPHDIQVIRLCTRCQARLFFSFRREREEAGRNLSLIGGEAWSLPGLRVA